MQALSGAHRHLAAEMADISLPVSLWLRSDVENAYGTDEWKKIMEDKDYDLTSY